MTQKQTASIVASWRDHPIGIQAEGLEVEELSFPVQSKKKGKVELRIESNRSDCATADKGWITKFQYKPLYSFQNPEQRETPTHILRYQMPLNPTL